MRVQPVHSFVAVVVACGWRSRALRHATTPGRFGLHLRGSAHHHSRVRPANAFSPGLLLAWPNHIAQAERQRQATRARPEVHGTFSQSGPWRPAVVARLALTLGVSQTASMAHVKAKHCSFAVLRSAASLPRARPVAATALSGRPPWRGPNLLAPRTGRLQPGAADSRYLFSTAASVASMVSAHSSNPRPPAPPNQSLKWTPNGVPPGPRSTLVHHALRGPGVTPPGST